MATIASTGGMSPANSRDLTPETAIRYAWICWAVLLVAPFIMFLFVVWQISGSNVLSPHANTWFIISMAYLAFAVPAALFWRSRIFRPYWNGEVVQPRDYLRGMIGVWITIEIGGLLSLLGCLMSGALMPCMLPAAVAFMFFTPLYPSGMAMVRRNVGNAEDPARYEEPR
jgi:hypothetical protein